jgi:hypothetical protein
VKLRLLAWSRSISLLRTFTQYLAQLAEQFPGISTCLSGLLFEAFYNRIDNLELGKKRIESAFPNQSRRIEKELAELKKEALEVGYDRMVVVAEATGNYHDSLLRAARRLDLDTARVSGEAVAKMRVIEFNDSGKTDLKDTRVIQLREFQHIETRS